jgi:hypothetical protein
MRSAISGLMAEIFLQYYKHLIVNHIVKNRNILFILGVCMACVIYDEYKMNTNDLINTINRFHINRSFSLTLGIIGQIQCFDLLIIRRHTTTDIFFRKPTTTATTIYYLTIPLNMS